MYAPYLTDANTITPGALVVLFDAAGNIIEHENTDSDGRATVVAPDNSSVTVIPPQSFSPRHVYSWYGVNSGDQLATEPEPAPVPPAGRTLPVILPRDGDDAAQYAVTGVGFGAYTGTPPATGAISLEGTLAATAPAIGDLVAESTHPGGHRFLVAQGVAFDALPIDLTTTQWQEAARYDRTIANLPAETAWASAYYELLAGGRILWQSGTRVSLPNASLTMHVESPGQAGDGTALELLYEHDGPWALSYNAPPSTIDLATLSPVATNIMRGVDYSVSWDATGATSAAVAVEVSLVGPTASWTIVMPPAQRAFIPAGVPSDFQDVPSLPTVHVAYISSNDPAGYAAVKRDPLVFNPYAYGQVMPTTPGVFRFAGGF